MAHGAPDHIRLSDDAFSHYDFHRPTSGVWVMGAGETRNLVDLDMVGVFGLVFMVVDNNESLLRVEVDGREVFEIDVRAAFATRQLYWGALGGIIGVTTYDEINDHYSLWFNANWKIYVHNHLTIQIQNLTLNPCNVRIIQGMYLKYKG